MEDVLVRKQLEEYVEENQERFYRWAYSYVKNEDAALDVVHEAIVQAFTHICSLRDPDCLHTWFYRILVNESLRSLRRYKRVLPMEEVPEDADAPQPDWGRRLDVARAVDGLNPKLRVIVMLRYYEDMPLASIAQVTGLNLSTVKTRLYKALGALKPMLKDWAGEDKLTR